MNWRSSLFALVISAFALFIVWASSDQGFCAVPIAVAATTKSEATWCWEFWLNRYQTLIGAIFALGAAIIAAALVYRQVNKAAEQNNISRQLLAISSLKMIIERIHHYDRIEYCIASTIEYSISASQKAVGVITSARGTAEGHVNAFLETARGILMDIVEAQGHARELITEARNTLAVAAISPKNRDLLSTAINCSEEFHVKCNRNLAIAREFIDVSASIGPIAAYDYLNGEGRLLIEDFKIPMIDAEYGKIAVVERERLNLLLQETLKQVEHAVI